MYMTWMSILQVYITCAVATFYIKYGLGYGVIFRRVLKYMFIRYITSLKHHTHLDYLFHILINFIICAFILHFVISDNQTKISVYFSCSSIWNDEFI